MTTIVHAHHPIAEFDRLRPYHGLCIDHGTRGRRLAAYGGSRAEAAEFVAEHPEAGTRRGLRVVRWCLTCDAPRTIVARISRGGGSIHVDQEVA